MKRNQSTRRGRSRSRRGGRFGLPDLVVVLLIFGVVTASAVPGFNRFMRSVDLNKQVQRIAAMLRVVRQRAITENNAYVVRWNVADHTWSWWDDDNNDGKQDEGEATEAPVALPAWIEIGRSGTNSFPSDSLRFLPDGSASASGSLIFSNSDGFKRSLSVVRLTGMVTVQ
jgi:Tfp pilus assembly protein FimT